MSTEATKWDILCLGPHVYISEPDGDMRASFGPNGWKILNEEGQVARRGNAGDLANWRQFYDDVRRFLAISIKKEDVPESIQKAVADEAETQALEKRVTSGGAPVTKKPAASDYVVSDGETTFKLLRGKQVVAWLNAGSFEIYAEDESIEHYPDGSLTKKDWVDFVALIQDKFRVTLDGMRPAECMAK